jgi:polysaccharide biosynthesis protein PslG
MQPRRWFAVILLAALVLTTMTIGPAFARSTTTTERVPQQPAATVEVGANAVQVQPTPSSGNFTIYTVQPGENLYRISLRFGTTMSAIAADNGIVNQNLIFAGQQLRIRAGIVPPPTLTPGPTVTKAPPTATIVPGTTGTYTVQRGDTLFRVAVRFNTTVAQMVALNNIANPNIIYVGQRLTVPSAGQTTQAQPTLTAPPPPTATLGAAPLAAATALPVSPTAPAPAAALPPAINVDFDYGIEAIISADNVAAVTSQISELGMGWVKVDVNWRDYEPTLGGINFAALDTIVSTLEQANLKILFTVSTSPEWARTTKDESGPPDDYATYSTFVGTLAGRYAGRVQAYEIWNEPNLRREWNSNLHNISAASYIDLLRQAYAAIKAVDPNAIVVSAGLAPTGFNDGVNAINDRIFLDSLYAEGLASVTDAIGAHPGGWANPPDATCCTASAGVNTHYEDRSFYFLDTLNDYRQAMVRNNDTDTAIWVTKFGWGTSEDTQDPPSIYIFVTYTSLGEQAIYTPRAFEIAQTLGYIGPMFLYNLNGCQTAPSAEACFYSLVGPNGEPRPVFSAVQAIHQAGGLEATEAVIDETQFTPIAPTQAATAELPAAPTLDTGVVQPTADTGGAPAPIATAESVG